MLGLNLHHFSKRGPVVDTIIGCALTPFITRASSAMTWTAQAIWLAAGDTRVPGYGGQYKHPKCHHIWHGVLSSTDELVHLSNRLPIGQGEKTFHESKIPAICWFRCEMRHQLTIWMTSNDLIIDAEDIRDDPQFYKPAKIQKTFEMIRGFIYLPKIESKVILIGRMVSHWENTL